MYDILLPLKDISVLELEYMSATEFYRKKIKRSRFLESLPKGTSNKLEKVSTIS